MAVSSVLMISGSFALSLSMVILIRGISRRLGGLGFAIFFLVFAAIKTGGRLSVLFLLLAYGAALGFFTVVHFLNRRRLKNTVEKSPETNGIL